MSFATALQKAIEKVNQIPGLGTDVTIRRISAGSYNTTTGTFRETDTQTTVKAVPEDVNQRAVNDLIASDDRVATIAANSVTAIPTTADRVIIGSDDHQIIRVKTISQAGVDISYKLYLRA